MHHFVGTGLCCAPTTCVVHHGAQGGPDLQCGSAQRSFVLIRWCTRRFCMFVINSDRDGALYDVVNLDVGVSVIL